MSPSLYSLMVTKDHAVPVEPYGGSALATVDQTGGTVFYADNPQVSAAVNQGSIAPGGSKTFTSNVWLISSTTAGVSVQVSSVYDKLSAFPPSTATTVDLTQAFGVSTTNVDNAPIINAALQVLGTQGLRGFLPPGTYNIQTPIVIGNGTSSSFSTWTGGLVGGWSAGGNSPSANNLGTLETKILWTGGALADGMVQLLGPLTGWELTNLKIDGGSIQASSPDWAIHFKSTVRGRMDNVAVAGCHSGIWHDSYAAVSGALAGVIVDDIFNQAHNIAISYTGKASSNTFGLLFDGGASGVSNTCYNLYEGLWFSGASSSLGGGATGTDLYFKRTDSQNLRNLTFDTRTGTDSKHTVTFDWSAVSQWPKGIKMDQVDFGGVPNTQFTAVGSPGGGASHNRISNISSANGQPTNPNLPLLQWGDNAYTGFATLVAGTVTVSGNAASGVVPGSFIQASRLLVGGTPIGHIGVGTRGTGSFVLESRNTDGTLCTTDTSSVLYRVVTDPFF